MLVNQRAECRFSIHFVVFFVLCACCFAYSLVLYFFNISFGLLWGREFFKGSSNFLHAMVLFRHLSIGERIVLS